MKSLRKSFTQINLILLFLLIQPISIKAIHMNFRKYEVNNGLSENTIQCIIQDNRGFMWFGTNDGLNRFDGNEFKIFKHEINNSQSLGNNFVISLFQDIDNRIWVGTDSRIYIFNPNTETFQPFSYKTADGISINTGVTSIQAENNDKIWIGTRSQGAFCFNKKSQVLTQYIAGNDNQTIRSNVVWRVFKDYAGNIWFGSRNGLSTYNKETAEFVTYGTRDKNSPISDPEVLSIFEDSEGIFWLGTWEGGLVKFNRTANEFTSFFTHQSETYITHIRSIFEYTKDELLIGSDDGLYLFNKNTTEYSRIDDPLDPKSLSDQNVYAIYKDREDGIWIGTYFGGINYLSPNSQVIEYYYPHPPKNSLSGKAVSQFCEDEKGNLWIATEDGGLNYFNTTTKQFKTYLPNNDKSEISYHNIHALTIFNEKLWIGTFSRGLDVMDLKTGKFKNYQFNQDDPNSLNDNCVFSLYKSEDDQLYIGTTAGLNRFNPSTDNFTRIKEVQGFVYDMTDDHQGNFWVAGYGEGVFKYNKQSKTWKNYRNIKDDKKSLPFNKISDVYLDKQKRLWFSTEGGGVSKYNYDTDDFYTINSLDGLPNNVVYGVIDDNYGNIWVSTNMGISCIDLNTKKIKTYTQEDGLQSNQFNYRSSLKTKNGKFYFGGINGFNAFYPNEIKENKYNPPVIITNFELLDTDVLQNNDTSFIELLNSTKHITLKHNEASFRISFVNLSYQAPSKNTNAYILENLNSRWIQTNSPNQASYINLKHGEYIFRVKGANNDGKWNNEGDYIKITILPPFWKTNYAYLLYFLIMAGIILLIIKNYVSISQTRQNKKLEDFRIKKEKETYISKINFFTNIAHEIRTPISLIKAPLDCIKTKKISQQELDDNIKVIDKNADRLLNLINQLLDFRKIEDNSYKLKFEPLEFNSLIADICYRFKPTASQRNISINTQIPDTTITCNADRDGITKIFSNLMTNAIKFTHSTVTISLKKSEDFVIIEVADDGQGIPLKYQERIFDPFFQVDAANNDDKKNGTGIGLAFSRQLAEKHNGNLKLIESREGKCIFQITISTNLKSEIKQEKRIPTQLKPQSNQSNLTSHAESNEKPSILIVEDNEDLSNFLEKNLKLEYTIYTAENGRIALEILENTTISIIISDVMMPEVDGIELVQKTRENEQSSHIPIILLSAKTNLDTKIEGLDFGADSYIEKPFSLDYLKAQVNSLLKNRKIILEKFANTPFVPYGSLANNKKDEEFLNKLNKEIENSLLDPEYSIENLANALSMSRSNLQRKIKGISGMTPNDYLRVYKLKKAAKLIIEGEYRINEICFLVGFNNPSYFSKCFHKQFGKLPSEFHKDA